MKDLTTGKTYLTRRTREIAGPKFAKAGFNVENLHDEKSILRAWSKTLTDEEAQGLLVYLSATPTAGPDPSEPA
jgi:hypothetical protein